MKETRYRRWYISLSWALVLPSIVLDGGGDIHITVYDGTPCEIMVMVPADRRLAVVSMFAEWTGA
jgi:hypothetical protein